MNRFRKVRLQSDKPTEPAAPPSTQPVDALAQVKALLAPIFSPGPLAQVIQPEWLDILQEKLARRPLDNEPTQRMAAMPQIANTEPFNRLLVEPETDPRAQVWFRGREQS